MESCVKQRLIPPVLFEPARRRLFYRLVIAGLLQSVCLFGLIYLMRQLLVGGTLSIDATGIAVALVGISGLALGRALERYLAEKLAQGYVSELRQQVYVHALELQVDEQESLNNGGALLRLTGDMSAIRNWIVQGLAPLAVQGTWLLAGSIALTLIHPLLLASLLLPVSIAIAGNFYFGRWLYSHSLDARLRRAELIRNIGEKLRSLSLIQSFNQQKSELKRAEKQNIRLRESLIGRAKVSGFLRGFNEAVLGICILTLLVTGIWLVEHQLLLTHELAIVLGASLYLLGHLRRFSRLYEYWTLKQVATHKLDAFFKRRGYRSRAIRSRVTAPFRLNIENYGCPGRFPPLTAVVEAHSRILLNGAGGSGKSTLLAALAGLRDGCEGRVEISGRRYRRLTPQRVSNTVAFVSSELALLKGSLRKNLFYGARKVEASYTQEVLKLCGLAAWINEHPDGLAMRLFEGGKNLSSSYRFRITLARALLRRPCLLLIDRVAGISEVETQQVLDSISSWFNGAIIFVGNAQMPARLFDQVWYQQASITEVYHYGDCSGEGLRIEGVVGHG